MCTVNLGAGTTKMILLVLYTLKYYFITEYLDNQRFQEEELYCTLIHDIKISKSTHQKTFVNRALVVELWSCGAVPQGS